ncbi:single-stranded-DNA-specific exonuclease RecJ [Desulfosporosinus sp. PR]|uniref:single-stranded-DNA-specific exonuclease RecJ n=1 Tax=Candidatus Desulfosporosinus nitrosoreducens TaxID=3401928 RepID=UPI0027FE298D|nr:single-stranded-DNA-specific exonuclease RecJ [Desulfosporosinus sp. PR]MDQ7095519.1 single-stranded-DNA-specific exonuclease RecJ [Desulfosporosinus sp. PR]
MKRIWTMTSSFGQMSKLLCKCLRISPIVSDILIQRNLREPEEVIEFLHPTLLNLASPFSFRQMPRVLERLSLALEKKEKVLVYGDYDVDGVTSTALLYKVLTDLGFQAVAYIPHRQDEGYGLHEEAIRRAARAEVKVLITVDCGVTAVSEVKIAKDLGIDVVITDHHEPPECLPEALALLNPKVADSGYPFRDLAGVGVAFKLAQALLQVFGNSEADVASEISLLDLVALGTIADLVPLVGENRVFVHQGLRQMENTVHPGLDALLQECGLKDKPLKAGQIGFMVAPRINAVGRMDSAREGLELLLTEDLGRAEELARLLTKENQSRQETEKEILAEAISLIEREPLPRVIVLSSDHWHHGVIGIVASRLVERYYRPVFMIAEEGKEAKGSARGIPGYPVLEQLKTQTELLEKYGGHSAAAGFSLFTENIGRLREGLNRQAAAFAETLFQEVLHIDRKISLEEVSADLLHDLEMMAPFGFGNPGPVLAMREIPVHSVNTVGKERNHLKFRFGNHGEQEGIAFRLGDRFSELNGSAKLDAAFSLDWNTFQGQDKVQLMIKDVQLKASWLGGEIAFEDDEQSTWQQVAAAQDGLDFEWLDWHELYPYEWTPADKKRIWVWDMTGLESHLDLWADSLLPNYFPRETLKNRQFLDKTGLSLGEDEGLGLILGLPLSAEEFEEGLEKFRQLGIYRLAISGYQDLQEERVRKQCGYLTRDELIRFYRELKNKASESNPFHVQLASREDRELKAALKIFEELGLLHCLGGSEKIALEWIPAQSRLDLETSLRYRYSKERFEQALTFQKKLLANFPSCREKLRRAERS